MWRGLASCLSVVVIAGCASARPESDGASFEPLSPPAAELSPAPSSAAPTTAPPTAVAVLPSSDLPTPEATLAKAPKPVVSAGVATTRPVVKSQYIPADITTSGIAISVSGTRFTPGQTVVTSSQAAPELAGFTAYLLASNPAGDISAVAVGAVGDDGQFTLSFAPKGRVRLISAVAQAGVTPQAAFDLNNVIARSRLVRIFPR